MAEDLTDYYRESGLKVKYLHSDIKTLERTEIIRELRLGGFDVLIGINLLREGLDIPEVSLVAILDADQEGFLRSERSLIQTCGRASRNVNGRVIMYAADVTPAMARAISETQRRRKQQEEYNRLHRISPASIRKNIQAGLGAVSERDYVTIPRVKESGDLYGSPEELAKAIKIRRKEMLRLAREYRYEEAAALRDEILRLEEKELGLG